MNREHFVPDRQRFWLLELLTEPKSESRQIIGVKFTSARGEEGSLDSCFPQKMSFWPETGTPVSSATLSNEKRVLGHVISIVQ